MQRLKKVFVLSVLLATVLSMSVVVGPVNAAAQAGDLIKMDGLSSVYYLGADGKRYVFPNEQTYFSWYSDFSGVVTVPQSELEGYSLGANVTMRPGTNLVKITTDPKVYAVQPDGNLLWVPSETAAKALWGDAWASKVVDVPDAFFTNYTVASGEVSETAYPTGALVKFGGTDIFYIDADGTARKVADEAAFAANRFNYDFVVDSTLAMPTEGTPIAGAEDGLMDTSSGAGGTAGAGTGLSVALSSMTAPSTSLIIGQTNASLASFNLTASNDGAVDVNTIKVKRVGVSADATLAEVYLYEGTTRLTENASVSSGVATFNNIGLTVAAGQTRTITVVAKLAGSAGETLGVSINAASDIVADGASVSGSFPVTGNTHSISSATLATVAFNATTLPSTGTVDAGESDFSVWKNTVQIGNRKVFFESIRFRQVGSVDMNDLENFRLFIDGVQYGGSMELSSDNYLQFTLDTPVTLQTGSRVMEVRANVVNGANKTFSLSVRKTVDVMVRDSEYGAYIAPSAIPATSGTQTVNVGSLTVTKATDSASGDVVKDASGVSLGKFEVKAFGESVKVEYLRVAFDASDNNITQLRNGALYANGVQIGSTAALNEKDGGTTYTDFSLGSSLIVTPGTPVMVEVRADIYDDDGTNSIDAGETIVAELQTYTNGAQRQSSLGFIDVPSALTTANTLTVRTGSASLSKFAAYGNQTVVVPQTNYKLGSYVVTSGSTEDVSLNTLEVGFTGNNTFTIADLNDVYVKYGEKVTSIKSSVSTATSTWSVSETLAAGGSLTIEVFANIGSSVTAGHTLSTAMAVTGLTSQSSQTTNSYAIGQTLTAGSASIAVAKDGSSAVSELRTGGNTVDTAAFKWSSTNDGYKIKEVIVDFPGSSAATAIASVQLKDGTTVLATAPVAGATTTFTGLNVDVPANGSKTLTVGLVLGQIGTGFGTSGADVQTRLATYKSAPNSTGTESTSAAWVSGDSQTVYKVVPTITPQTLPSSVLTAGGTNTLAKFSVAGDGGEMTWKKIVFTVSTSTNIANLTSIALQDANTSTDIAGTATWNGSSITFVATTEQAISGAKTYALKANVNGGSIATNDYVSTSIARPSTSVISNDYSTVAGGTGSFIWSDESANGHSESTTDWHNDYLMKNLPTDSQVITK